MRNSRRHMLFIVPPYIVPPAKDAKIKGVRSFLAFPYGALTVASYVEKHCSNDISVSILDLNVHVNEDAMQVVENYITAINPDIVGISFSYDVSYHHILPLSRKIKQLNHETIVVIGGPAATVAWEDFLDDQEYIDALCYGEGETALKDLLDADDMRVALKQDPWMTRGRKDMPVWKYHENLDDTLDVNYSLIDMSRYNMKEAFSPFSSINDQRIPVQFFIVTSRGCPFKCVFCAEPAFNGKSMRYVSVDKVIDHIRCLTITYGMNILTIYDDQLLIDRQRAKEIFLRLAEFNLRIEMPNGVTVSYIDTELAQLMRQAGVRGIFLAIESGSEYVLRHIINKPLTVAKVRPVVDALHDADIFVQGFFINGFPGELPEHRATTLDKIKEWGIDWSYFNYASPLRGSKLYDDCKKNGWIDEKYLRSSNIDMTKHIINAPGLESRAIEQETYLMNLDVNFVNNNAMRTGRYDIAARCFEAVIERHPGQAFAHYFLAKAYDALGEKSENSKRCMEKFLEIIKSDAVWRSYAVHYELI